MSSAFYPLGMKSYNNHISRNCCKVTPVEISCQYCYKTFTRNYNKNIQYFYQINSIENLELIYLNLC